MIATGKPSGRFIIGSGIGVNPGRLAGGAVGIKTYEKQPDTFGKKRSVYSNFNLSARPGGLIDKVQQKDPAATVFAHPFDNGDYRSTGTRPLKQPKTSWNVTEIFQPLTQHVPEIMPHERGRFFRTKQVPVVKTQFGAAQTGAKSDTSFHPQVKRVIMDPIVQSSIDSAKLVNRLRPPSFHSVGNLWGYANHSFIAGRPNTLSGQIGKGRWETVKRSVV